MPTLLIEHAVNDFDTWNRAFGRFAEKRRQGGVLRERILQPVDDPHYVIVDLEFATLDEARSFRRFLETQVWSTPANSPALVGTPQARVVDTAPVAAVL